MSDELALFREQLHDRANQRNERLIKEIININNDLFNNIKLGIDVDVKIHIMDEPIDNTKTQVIIKIDNRESTITQFLCRVDINIIVDSTLSKYKKTKKLNQLKQKILDVVGGFVDQPVFSYKGYIGLFKYSYVNNQLHPYYYVL